MTRLPVTLDVNEMGTGTVTINGHDLSNVVRGVNVYTQVGHLPEVVLEMSPSAITFDGQARVQIPEELAAVLTLLGWTPPSEVSDRAEAIQAGMRVGAETARALLDAAKRQS